MLLQNRSVTIGLVKTPKQEITNEDATPFIDPETITLIRHEVKKAAIILGALYLVKVAAETAGKVTVMSMEAKLLK